MDTRRSLGTRSNLTKSQFSFSKKTARSSLSPFQRLTSDFNIQSMLLPKFLRTETPQGMKKIKIPFQVAKKPENFNEILQFIENAKSPMSKLLRVGKFELKKDDLNSLVSGFVSTAVIDATFTVAKFMNSQLCKGKTGKRVSIAKTKFSQKLFGNDVSSAANGDFNCGLMIFPVFVGYWTLLTFNSEQMILSYYDPLNNYKYLKEIIKNFYRYLNKQAHKIKNLAEKNLKEIVCQKIVNIDIFLEEDSAIYMMKTAIGLCLNEEANLKNEDILRYRGEILILLFQYGKL